MKTKYDIGQIITGYDASRINKYDIERVHATKSKTMYYGHISTRNPDGTWSKFCGSFDHSEENITKFIEQYKPEFIMNEFGIEVQAATVFFKDDKEGNKELTTALKIIRGILMQEPDNDTGTPTDGECLDLVLGYINDMLGG